MKIGIELHFLSKSILFLLIGHMLESACAASYMAHSHHNKRQQPAKTPQLTLSVEPHHGIEPHHSHPSVVRDFYFLLGSGLFNFTCTIKHPSHRYRLLITREFKKPDGTLTELNYVDQSDYILNTNIKDDRFSIEYSEPKFLDPNADFIRLSLLIKNLRLDDTGVYTCKYSSILNKINTIVYKAAGVDEVHFPAEKVDRVKLNEETSLTCRVTDVYPKPQVTIAHPGKPDLHDKLTETDESVPDQSSYYYLQTLKSTYKFTPTYSDNNANLTCTVVSTGANNSTVTKSHILSVEGVQIIEDKCAKSVKAAVNDQEVRISCVFFANPKIESAYFEIVKPKAAQPANAENQNSNNNNLENTNPVIEQSPEQSQDQPSEANADASSPSTPEVAHDDIIKIESGGNHENYFFTIEEYTDGGHAGLYEAVLKIKDVRAEDFRTFTLKIADNVVKSIKVLGNAEYLKDSSIGDAGNRSWSPYTLFKHHSTSMRLFLLVNLIMAFKYVLCL